MTTIALFSSIHGDEMQKKFGWDDDQSVALFDQFHPDLVCGEVRKSDYEQNAEYQGPSEYRRYIFNYCKERGPKFPSTPLSSMHWPEKSRRSSTNMLRRFKRSSGISATGRL